MPGTNPQDFWSNDQDDLPSEEEAAAIEADSTPVAYNPETGLREEPNPAAEVVEEIYSEAPAKPARTVNKALERIQKAQDRLDIAACYRLLLDGSLFEVNSPAVRKVDAEIREFVCQRLEVLMGVQPEAQVRVVDQVSEVFSGNEIKVLKAIAKAAEKKVLEAQKAKEETVAAPAPTLKKVVNEDVPVRKPSPPVQAPAPVQPQQPPQRRQFQQPQLKRPAAQQQPLGKQASVPGRVAVDDARIPEIYKTDPTLKITPDGKVLVQGRDADGKPIFEFNSATRKFDKPFMKNVALPARPSPNSVQPIPMAPIEQMMGPGSPLMQQHADGMLGFAERRAAGLKIGSQFAGTLVQQISNQENNDSPGD